MPPDAQIGNYSAMTIETLPPPDHELHEMSDGSHVYRVGFWGLNDPPSTASWGVVWWDLRAEDVHEVIEWADARAGSELIYTLYVRFTDPHPPQREWMIRIAGAKPTMNSPDSFRPQPVRV
jgi:hypothetical protein